MHAVPPQLAMLLCDHDAKYLGLRLLRRYDRQKFRPETTDKNLKMEMLPFFFIFGRSFPKDFDGLQSEELGAV